MSFFSCLGGPPSQKHDVCCSPLVTSSLPSLLVLITPPFPQACMWVHRISFLSGGGLPFLFYFPSFVCISGTSPTFRPYLVSSLSSSCPQAKRDVWVGTFTIFFLSLPHVALHPRTAGVLAGLCGGTFPALFRAYG